MNALAPMNLSWNTASVRRSAVRARGTALLITVALHAVALWALLQFADVRRTLLQVAPIMVRYIEPPKPVEPPRPVDVPKRHQPPKLAERHRTVEPPKPPLPVPPPAVPPPAVAPPAETPPPVQSAPAPLAIPTEQAAASPPPMALAAVPERPSAAPAPPPVIPPSFSAAYLDNPPPEYPSFSRRNREEGKVLLRVHVTEGGRADQIEVQTSSGSRRLDGAARDAVSAWRFVPARQGDRAVAAWVTIPIQFRLEEG